MRNLIFVSLVASLFFIPAVAQENSVSSSGSAASAGAIPEVGVSFGGVSMVSITLAATIITSLLAFALEDSSDATPATDAPASTN